MTQVQLQELKREFLKSWVLSLLINTDEEIETAAILFSIAPWLLGGVCVKTHDSVLGNAWLIFLKKLLPVSFPALQKIPFNVQLDALVGGIDISSSISKGYLIEKRGVFNQKKKNFFVIKKANQITDEIISCLCNEIDSNINNNELFAFQNSSFIVFDELSPNCGDEEERGIRDSLIDRFCILLNFPIYSSKNEYDWKFIPPEKNKLKGARARLPFVKLSEDNLKALTATSLAFGIKSLRPLIFATNLLRVISAYEGRLTPNNDDVKLAIKFVLLPRAIQFPAKTNDDQAAANDEIDNETEDDQAAANNEIDNETEDESSNVTDEKNLTQYEDKTQEQDFLKQQDDAFQEKEEKEMTNSAVFDNSNEKIIDSAETKISSDLLNELSKREINFLSQNKKVGGKTGAEVQKKIGTGRFFGSTKGKPSSKIRLNLLDTIKASLPHQKIRARKICSQKKLLISVQPEDFRVYKRKSRRLITTIFLVDASGSSATNRLGEAKGAVELLLSECYVRRDKVAVINFRKTHSELVLPPTRSLVRAKKTLAGLPGGGGTPLATALDDCKVLVENLLSENQTPVLVLLTDGGANVCRDGRGGREKAHAEALSSSQGIKNLGINSIFIDTSVVSNQKSMAIAASMGAKYYPLPKASSSKIIEKIMIE